MMVSFHKVNFSTGFRYIFVRLVKYAKRHPILEVCNIQYYSVFPLLDNSNFDDYWTFPLLGDSGPWHLLNVSTTRRLHTLVIF